MRESLSLRRRFIEFRVVNLDVVFDLAELDDVLGLKLIYAAQDKRNLHAVHAAIVCVICAFEQFACGVSLFGAKQQAACSVEVPTLRFAAVRSFQNVGLRISDLLLTFQFELGIELMQLERQVKIRVALRIVRQVFDRTALFLPGDLTVEAGS